MAAAALAVTAFAADAASAQQMVSGYTRGDGTYVAPYVRSTPNSTTADNYGSSRSSSYAPAPAPLYTPPPTYQAPAVPACSGAACYGQPSTANGRPRTTYVQGYYRRDGTYVQGYYRSSPND